MKHNVICIIGMHRSGTSLVARLLQHAGLCLGPEERLLGPDSANPEGHYEHTGFLEINNALLQHLGGSWDAPPRTEPGWELDASLAELRARAESLVGSFAGGRPWGWKEPRTTILLPFWRTIINHPRFVICVRSPLDVAKSLASRNHITIEHGVDLWSRYMRAAIKETRGCARQLIFYDEFFDSDGVVTRRLLEFCGLKSIPDVFDLDGNIRSSLRHHRSETEELLDNASVPLHPKLLYLGLRTLLAGECIAKEITDESIPSIGRLLELLDEFHNQGRIGALETALDEKQHELSRARAESNMAISALTEQLVSLQQHADRLQKFADAVRQTWAYRIYRALIAPMKNQ
jgi:hypothetical protein